MIVLHVPNQLQPEQISNFPEDCERSVAGALHFAPGSTKTITVDEYDHLVKTAPAFASCLAVLKKPVKKEAKKKPAPKPAAPKEKATESEVSKESPQRGRSKKTSR